MTQNYSLIIRQREGSTNAPHYAKRCHEQLSKRGFNVLTTGINHRLGLVLTKDMNDEDIQNLPRAFEAINRNNQAGLTTYEGKSAMYIKENVSFEQAKGMFEQIRKYISNKGGQTELVQMPSEYLVHIEQGIEKDQTGGLVIPKLNNLLRRSGEGCEFEVNDGSNLKKIVLHLEDQVRIKAECKPALEGLGYKYVDLPLTDGTDVRSPDYWKKALEPFNNPSEGNIQIIRGIYDLHLGSEIKGNGVLAALESTKMFARGELPGPWLNLVFTTLRQEAASDLNLAPRAAGFWIETKDTSRNLASQIEKAFKEINSGKLKRMNTFGW